MNVLKLKKWYLTLSLILSLYLVVITILGFTSISSEALAPYNKISVYVLYFFVIELIILFFMTDSKKAYFKEQWVSIVAVLSSLTVTFFVDAAIGIGSLTGLKALKGIKAAKAIKSIKAVKGVKLLKVTKGAKVAKTVKLGKKTRKVKYSIENKHQKNEE